MTLETGTYIGDFTVNGSDVIQYPEAGANMSEGDDAIRETKQLTYNTLKNLTGEVTATHTELNYLDGLQQNLSVIYRGSTSSLVDSTVSSNDYPITTNTSLTLAAGMRFTFMADGANTGNDPTVTVDSNSAKTVKYADGTQVTTGDIADNAIVEIIYDGTDFRWLV